LKTGVRPAGPGAMVGGREGVATVEGLVMTVPGAAGVPQEVRAAPSAQAAMTLRTKVFTERS
jgi:hypothetical protein